MFCLSSQQKTNSTTISVINPAVRQLSRYFSSTSRMYIDNIVKVEPYQYKFYNFNNELLDLAYTKDCSVSSVKKLSSWALRRSLFNINNCVNKNIGHPYHLVTPSLMPVALSIALFCVFQNLIGFMWFEGWQTLSIYQFHAFFFINLFCVILTWILEVFKEEQTGSHTTEVQSGFRYAILLFILSELMLFVSFFWAYFHYTLNSNSFTGGTYTPRGVVVFHWYRIPLLNTLLLLSSGLSLTIAHILLVQSDKKLRSIFWATTIKVVAFSYRVTQLFKFNINNKPQTTNSFAFAKALVLARKVRRLAFANVSKFDIRTSDLAIINNRVFKKTRMNIVSNIESNQISVLATPEFWILDTALKGFVFLVYQAYEYTSSMFTITDSIYGAVFFSLTGLHGLHVFIGVMGLFTYVIISFAKGTLYQNYTKVHNRTINRMVLRKLNTNTYYSAYAPKHYSHRIAFDGAAWYWHFVDVVWFLVFVLVYWWGYTN